MLRSIPWSRSLILLAPLGWLACETPESCADQQADSQILCQWNVTDANKPPESSVANEGDASIEPLEQATRTSVAAVELEHLPPAPQRERPLHFDSRIQPANATVPSERDARHLAPPAQPLTSLGEDRETGKISFPQLFNVPQLKSLSTAGAGLAVVIGLLLVCTALVKRGGTRTGGILPQEAVSSLGRIPLTAKHTAHLLQVGSKLVLVAISADGIDKITEVTEPSEVDRLLGVCMKTANHSTTAEFQRMLSELSKEPARGFLGRESSPFSRSA